MIGKIESAVKNPRLAYDFVKSKAIDRVGQIQNKYRNFLYFSGDTHTEKVGETEIYFDITDYYNRNHVRRLFNTNRNELPIMLDFTLELKPKDVFWDVGGHIGVYSIIASNTIPDEQIYVFEPVPENIEHIRKNIKLNSAGNIKILSKAISQDVGESQLQVNPKYRMGSLKSDKKKQI